MIGLDGFGLIANKLWVKERERVRVRMPVKLGRLYQDQFRLNIYMVHTVYESKKGHGGYYLGPRSLRVRL